VSVNDRWWVVEKASCQYQWTESFGTIHASICKPDKASFAWNNPSRLAYGALYDVWGEDPRVKSIRRVHLQIYPTVGYVAK
jgi:hypothetical protein